MWEIRVGHGVFVASEMDQAVTQAVNHAALDERSPACRDGCPVSGTWTDKKQSGFYGTLLPAAAVFL